jgi:AcrR family transcriptional regulator
MPDERARLRADVAAERGRPVTESRAPKTERGAATHRRLVDAARAELVERDGVLEIDSVAARSGMSVGAIYRHFDSRAGLVGAVVDDFYTRYRTDALETNPSPGGTFAERERKRTELTVAFHYSDPLARVILSSLHLDAAVAVREAAHIDEMVELTAGVMNLGQFRGELPEDRDSRLMGAMIIGGMRRVLAVALASTPPIPQQVTARELWVLNAAIMGISPD